MTKGAKKGIGKTKIVLLIFAVLIVVLTVSNVWLYLRVNSLQTKCHDLQAAYDNYKTTHMHSNSEYNSLRVAQLHEVNFKSEVYRVLFGTDYVTVNGTIFNSGSDPATNVIFTIRVYNSDDVLIEDETFYFGTIPGKRYLTFGEKIYAEGAHHVTTSLTHMFV